MIYFLLAPSTGYIKIGYTEDEQTLPGRLPRLQTGNGDKLEVLRTIEGTKADEHALHCRFDRWRLEGGREWFKPNHELLKLVGRDETSLHQAPTLLDPAIMDAYQRGYDAGYAGRGLDVEAEVSRRVVKLEEQVKKAHLNNRLMGQSAARERRSHREVMKRFAADHGVDQMALERWRVRHDAATLAAEMNAYHAQDEREAA